MRPDSALHQYAWNASVVLVKPRGIEKAAGSAMVEIGKT